MSAERLVSNKGLSNSIAVIFAEGGIMLGVFCLLPFVACLMQIFKHNQRDIGLWAIGVFGIYCVMIFHFHLYFIMLVAFGYSLFDSSCSLKERKFRITMCKYDCTACSSNLSASTGAFSNKIVFIKNVLLVFIAILLITNKVTWDYLYSFLSSYKLLLGYSVWRTICLVVTVIYFFILLKHLLCSFDKNNFIMWLWRTVRFVFCTLLFCLFYSQMYSFIIDYSSRHNLLLSDAKESMLLFLVFGGFVITVELLLYCLKKIVTKHTRV